MDINQDKPEIVSWQLWQKAMQFWANEDALHQPLGRWYKSNAIRRTHVHSTIAYIYSGHQQTKQH
eukprot:4198646-Ditylum_brightwellii.AAC.1